MIFCKYCKAKHEVHESIIRGQRVVICDNCGKQIGYTI
jgi:hypothetical protein